MARGINKVILIGNLGADPQVRYMPSGGAVANISLATSESWKDRETGAQQERTEWHRVVFFNRLGEIVGEYLRKGSKIYVEGSLRTRKWTDNNNQERYTTEIVGSAMQMLDSRGDNAGGYGGGPSSGAMADNRGPGGQQDMGGSAPGSTENMATSGGDPEFDDDIPF